MELYTEYLKLEDTKIKHKSSFQMLSNEEYKDYIQLFEHMVKAGHADKVKAHIGDIYFIHEQDDTTLFLFYDGKEDEE